MTHRLLTVATALLLAPWPVAHAQSNRPPTAKPDARLEKLKVEALAKVDGRAKLVQEWWIWAFPWRVGSRNRDIQIPPDSGEKRLTIERG